MNLRRLKRTLTKPEASADEIIDALDVEVPKVVTLPHLEDFGLSPGAVNRIEAARKARLEKLEKIERRVFLVSYPTFICIFTLLLLIVRGDYHSGEDLVGEAIAGVPVGAFAGLLVVYAPIHEYFEGKRNGTTHGDKALSEYRNAVANYEHWQQKQ